ncbi:unnamed protein product [Lampetra planeri]
MSPAAHRCRPVPSPRVSFVRSLGVVATRSSLDPTAAKICLRESKSCTEQAAALFNLNRFKAKSQTDSTYIMELQYADDDAITARSEDMQSPSWMPSQRDTSFSPDYGWAAASDSRGTAPVVTVDSVHGLCPVVTSLLIPVVTRSAAPGHGGRSVGSDERRLRTGEGGGGEDGGLGGQGWGEKQTTTVFRENRTPRAKNKPRAVISEAHEVHKGVGAAADYRALEPEASGGGAKRGGSGGSSSHSARGFPLLSTPAPIHAERQTQQLGHLLIFW